jgi:hypothetical protein
MTRLALLFAIGAVFSTEALAVPQPEAEAAYARGDYATAFKLWFPLAEGGSARAQMNIARMYERGEWVAKDPAMAAEWYRRAADQSARDAALPQPVIAPAAAVAQPVVVQPMMGPLMPMQRTKPLNQPTRRSYTPPAMPPPVAPSYVATPTYTPAYAPVYTPAYAPLFAPYRAAPVLGYHHHHNHCGHRH